MCVLQGNDEEAVLDQGKTSSTLYTNFEKEELESESSVYTHTVEKCLHSVFTVKQKVAKMIQPVFIH